MKSLPAERLFLSVREFLSGHPRRKTGSGISARRQIQRCIHAKRQGRNCYCIETEFHKKGVGV